jgi:hypothetical protein
MLQQKVNPQTGVRKSIKLTPEEHTALKAFGTEYDTIDQKAKKLGVTRSALYYALENGSGRGDNIKSIRTALKKYAVLQNS